MHRIGVGNLIKGAAPTDIAVFSKALLSIGLVCWHELYAASSIIPVCNPRCRPAFDEDGDLAQEGCLDIIEQLVVLPGGPPIQR